MGRRGPAPNPTALRLLHGDKPYRINDREPRPRELEPQPPTWLSRRAAEEWARVMPDLLAMGTVRAADRDAIAAYCEAVALLATLSRLVADTGPLIVGKDGIPHKNPVVAQRRDASSEVRMWARELGLTPAARQPLRIEHDVRLPAERLRS
jgi:P27 family predicted phage terminase small subunit